MWFLPGLPGHRIGWFVRLHYVMADGLAGVAELGALLDAVPNVAHAPAQPWADAPPPSSRALFLDNVQRRVARLTRASRAVSQLAAFLDPLVRPSRRPLVR